MRWLRTDRVKLNPRLAGLFPIRPPDLEAVAASMRAGGYDQAEPLVIWESEGVLVDGHTRLAAAGAAGLERVYVDERPFDDERSAFEYAIGRQRDRRNLTRQELAGFIARAVAALDTLKPAGRPTAEKLASPDAHFSGKSAEATAALVGASPATVERTRVILASDDEETKLALTNGRTTVNGAYAAVRQLQAAQLDSAQPEPLLAVQTVYDASDYPEVRATYTAAEWQMLTVEQKAAVVEFAPYSDDGRRSRLNQVNEHIDWAKWSWNPVTGCLHNCDYCYARDIAERFFTQKFVPSFLPSRLRAPRQTTVPKAAATQIGWKNIFTCSMADLFGKWVPQEWIDAVFDEVRGNPQWNFLFLTKFPRRLAELDWPENAWCGASVDRQHRVADTEAAFRGVRAGVKWLSCEPMLERLTFSSLEMFDWVVIGSASKSTQTPEFQPPWEWVEHLMAQARSAGCRVFIKPNLRSRPQEYPGEVATSTVQDGWPAPSRIERP